MKLFPAIDLKDGQVVRLTMGDYGRVERYGGTPAGFAQSYEADGAHYLHVVDLDGDVVEPGADELRRRWMA